MIVLSGRAEQVGTTAGDVTNSVIAPAAPPRRTMATAIHPKPECSDPIGDYTFLNNPLSHAFMSPDFHVPSTRRAGDIVTTRNRMPAYPLTAAEA
jgi:hypothetical protein